MRPNNLISSGDDMENLLLQSPPSKYKLGLFKRKGALLVLLWSFCGLYIFHKLLGINVWGSNISALQKTRFTSVWFITATSIAVYPFFGWLADVHFGRYKVIKYSLHLMWLISSLFCLAFVVIISLEEAGIIEETRLFPDVIITVLVLVLAVALSGFMPMPFCSA